MPMVAEILPLLDLKLLAQLCRLLCRDKSAALGRLVGSLVVMFMLLDCFRRQSCSAVN